MHGTVIGWNYVPSPRPTVACRSIPPDAVDSPGERYLKGPLHEAGPAAHGPHSCCVRGAAGPADHLPIPSAFKDGKGWSNRTTDVMHFDHELVPTGRCKSFNMDIRETTIVVGRPHDDDRTGIRGQPRMSGISEAAELHSCLRGEHGSTRERSSEGDVATFSEGWHRETQDGGVQEIQARGESAWCCVSSRWRIRRRVFGSPRAAGPGISGLSPKLPALQLTC